MSKIKFELTIDTSTGEFSVVNTETGEIKSTTYKSSKKSKVEESSEPTLILGDNKYSLNTAAIELMGVEPGCKLDIKYEKKGKETIPVIGSDESFGTHNGNKICKGLTVACRGSKNAELAKYGSEFTLVSHEIKDGIFILQSKDAKPVIEEEELPIDIQGIIDDTTEVDSSIFQL